MARHDGRAEYRANHDDQQAWESALRPKPCLLAIHSKLQEIVTSKLMLEWSPEQISGWLKQQYPENESLRVSHETIYRSLFIQADLQGWGIFDRRNGEFSSGVDSSHSYAPHRHRPTLLRARQ